MLASSELQELVVELARPVALSDGAVDTIIDPAVKQAYEQFLDELELRQLRDLADQLNERERAVLRAYYGLGVPVRTLNQIGARLGLTAKRAPTDRAWGTQQAA